MFAIKRMRIYVVFVIVVEPTFTARTNSRTTSSTGASTTAAKRPFMCDEMNQQTKARKQRIELRRCSYDGFSAIVAVAVVADDNDDDVGGGGASALSCSERPRRCCTRRPPLALLPLLPPLPPLGRPDRGEQPKRVAFRCNKQTHRTTNSTKWKNGKRRSTRASERAGEKRRDRSEFVCDTSMRWTGGAVQARRRCTSAASSAERDTTALARFVRLFRRRRQMIHRLFVRFVTANR
jgi:hypothetical protein